MPRRARPQERKTVPDRKFGNVTIAEFNNKLLVFTQWVWSYFTWQRGSRLILGRH